MKKIKIKNKYALVDNEDYEWLKGFKWRLCGNLKYGGYAGFNGSTINEKKQTFYMHHLIFLVKEIKRGCGYEVNHINGNTLDNRSKNLELITHKENCIKRNNA